MIVASGCYKVHQCSKCPGDTEYYCLSCPCDLCPQCKDIHVNDLKTIDHNVELYREKFNYILKKEICMRHPGRVYRGYCDICQLLVCYRSKIQCSHKALGVRIVNETKLQRQRRFFHTIRSDTLFYRSVLLKGVKDDFKIFYEKLSFCQSEMIGKAQRLKDLIDTELADVASKHKWLKQRRKLNGHIAILQLWEHRHEISPLQFLIDKARFLQILDGPSWTYHTSKLFMTKSLNKEYMIESLNKVKIINIGNRRVGNERLLKPMSAPELHQYLTPSGVDHCYHISCVTSDRVWVSDRNKNLILKNTGGYILHHLKDLCIGYGVHTVNSESELIYIDRNYNINKLSKDMKTTTTFIEITDSKWKPRCVYWSPFTGDLLVGMNREYVTDIFKSGGVAVKSEPTNLPQFNRVRRGAFKIFPTGKVFRVNQTGKATRYNKFGTPIQTIQRDSTGLELYRYPTYITENNNGDVVVSDYERAIVVTNRKGIHRFSYTGHPSGSGLLPCGICTDALSHILLHVCDERTNTVQILDVDGQFLLHLQIISSEILKPYSLTYEIETHRIWIGSWDNNKVCVYRYMIRESASSTAADLNE